MPEGLRPRDIVDPYLHLDAIDGSRVSSTEDTSRRSSMSVSSAAVAEVKSFNVQYLSLEPDGNLEG